MYGRWFVRRGPRSTPEAAAAVWSIGVSRRFDRRRQPTSRPAGPANFEYTTLSRGVRRPRPRFEGRSGTPPAVAARAATPAGRHASASSISGSINSPAAGTPATTGASSDSSLKRRACSSRFRRLLPARGEVDAAAAEQVFELVHHRRRRPDRVLAVDLQHRLPGRRRHLEVDRHRPLVSGQDRRHLGNHGRVVPGPVQLQADGRRQLRHRVRDRDHLVDQQARRLPLLVDLPLDEDDPLRPRPRPGTSGRPRRTSRRTSSRRSGRPSPPA